MNIIYFLIFGFLSSLLGNLLGILANIVGLALAAVARMVENLNAAVGRVLLIFTTTAGFILLYYCWAVGSTTGLLIASKYSESSTVLKVVFTIIIAFLNLRVWKIYLTNQEKNRKVIKGNPMGLKVTFASGDYLIMYAIIIPIILFSWKSQWATPYFDFIYRVLSNWLPT